MPLNISREDLTDLLLTRQAKELAQRTKQALRQVLGQSGDVNIADLDQVLEEPYMSAYSLGGSRSQSMLEEREVSEGWQYVVAEEGHRTESRREMEGGEAGGGGGGGGGERGGGGGGGGGGRSVAA